MQTNNGSDCRSVVAWEGIKGATVKGQKENWRVRNQFVILIVSN